MADRFFNCNTTLKHNVAHNNILHNVYASVIATRILYHPGY